jgi:hypothetical protein
MDALKRALIELGYGVHEGSHNITSFGQTRTFDMSITKNGKQLPVGWIKEEDGYRLEGDFYMTGIDTSDFGKQISQLHTKYKTTDWLTQKGYRVSYEKNSDGKTVVVGTKW